VPCPLAGIFRSPPAAELDLILAGKAPGILPATVFVTEANDGALLGFLEAGLRSHADGCDPSHPVGYVEGWYVVESHRHHGIGAALLRAAEDWARTQGCTEMASDTQVENLLSQCAHAALGFHVAERSILYRKPL
jgi:aminoglycoside 6'-N-acetyltransferase I